MADFNDRIEGFKNRVNNGEYTSFNEIVRPTFRQAYAGIFKKNFELATEKLKKGEILSLSSGLVGSTCWVGPGQTLIDNPAAEINPLLKDTKVAADSEKSDYAKKLAEALKESKVTSVELPAAYESNGITIWRTTQEDRDTIMAALPSTVKNFSIRYGAGGFTNKDLQNLTDLMNRSPGMEVHLCFSTYGNPKVGPFDDKTYEAFVKAAEKSNGIYLEHPGHSNNPLFCESRGWGFSKKRQEMLEKSVGAKAMEIFGGFAFDKNYAAKKAQKENSNGYNK